MAIRVKIYAFLKADFGAFLNGKNVIDFILPNTSA
tara:strand:+ start:4295 stop:4399 length:105 start_codon:yes stop_codon:yes gene_type:complete